MCLAGAEELLWGQAVFLLCFARSHNYIGMWLFWSRCCDPPEKIVPSGPKRRLGIWLTSLQQFLFFSFLSFPPVKQTSCFILDNMVKQTLGSQSADTQWSYVCRLASIHRDSWGYGPGVEVEKCHISPYTHTHTHTHTRLRTNTTHVPTCTKTDCNPLFLSQTLTVTSSQLRPHQAQMNSVAHVNTGWTDADRWKGWGNAPITQAHQTYQSAFHLREGELCLCFVFF